MAHLDKSADALRIERVKGFFCVVITGVRIWKSETCVRISFVLIVKHNQREHLKTYFALSSRIALTRLDNSAGTQWEHETRMRKGELK